jgi:hypothetical protein
MRFVAFTSKLWTCGLLAFVASFGVIIGMFSHRLPLVPLAIFATLIGLALIAIGSTLVSAKPRLQIDEEGITCYQPFYGTIPWEDIVAVERIPRVEKQTFGSRVRYNMSFCDAWRPIDITVRGLDKYSKLLPAGVHNFLTKGLPQNGDPDVFKLRLELSGISGSSADALEVIRHFLPQNLAHS